ncbi:MAG: hypothetical protein GY810_09170 [Aureispira sp.]|nr:hypothetical protein [Aureispira sp.]
MDESTINYINRIESELAKLKLKLKESPITEEPMLECTGGDWYLEAFAEAICGNSTDDCRIIGVEYETEAKAIEAGKRRVQQEIINNHAIRLNKKDEFVVDWEDAEQLKYYMHFNHLKRAWGYDCTYYIQPTGDVAISEESAIYLQAKLNKGLITGVNANGDI